MEKIKILFIIPPNIDFGSFINPDFNERTTIKKSGTYGNIIVDIPIGILSMSAYLKKYIPIEKIETRLIDFNIILNKMESFYYLSFSELYQDTLKDIDNDCSYCPTIISISVLFTPAYQNMIDLTKIAKNIFPDALIIAGGGVPTNMYNEIFRDTNDIDAICYGEGEKPLLGLIKTEDKKKFLDTNSSWITREKLESSNELKQSNESNQSEFKYDFIQNLDEIPFYDYDLLNLDDYAPNNLLSLFPLEKERDLKSIPLETSRGCIFRCCFCSSYTVHGRKMRYYSINRIVQDIKYLKEKYGVETIVFFDDHFLSNKKRVFDIIKILRELELTAFFPSSLALFALDREVLSSLKSIGVNNLILSVESGSQKVLRLMEKPLSRKIIKRVIDDCRYLNISTDVSILIGLPGETKQDIEDAREFFKTINPNWYRFSVATPLPGSELFKTCKENNYFINDNDNNKSFKNCDYKKCVIQTEDWTPEYIQEKAYYLNLELNFVLNSDMKLGNYDIALKEFENVIRLKNDHGFAYYFAAECADKLGLDDKYIEYKDKYQKIIDESQFWRYYSNQFNLLELE